MSDLKELAERLEKATGNLDNWSLDGDVNTFTSGEIDRWSNALFGFTACTYGDETLLRNALKGSVDAALTLVERLLKCSDSGEVLYDINLTGSMNEPEHCWPAAALRWYPRGHSGHNYFACVAGAPTPALAILRALVTALIEQESAS